jgi:hypothetical protein
MTHIVKADYKKESSRLNMRRMRHKRHKAVCKKESNRLNKEIYRGDQAVQPRSRRATTRECTKAR